VRTLAERAQIEGTPIIDGNTATLVWRGQQAPRLAGDFNDWDWDKPVALQQIAPGVWAYTLELPRDAYIEYAYMLGDKRVADPLNPRSTPDGVGSHNHFFYMPDAAATPLAWRRRDVPHGSVTRHTIRTDGLAASSRRSVHLYQPPTTEPCPLVVVFDGRDYLHRAGLTVIVDNLLAEGRIRPIALAMVDNGGRARTVEYACSESTVGLVLYPVLSLARAHLNLSDVEAQPGAYGVLGASLGGLISLYTALRAPHIFGRVLSQSGAFGWGVADSVVFDLIRDGGHQPIKIWMDIGQFEGLLAANRRMHALLMDRGYDVTYREYHAGHNYPAWRDDVWRGLEALFGTHTVASDQIANH